MDKPKKSKLKVAVRTFTPDELARLLGASSHEPAPKVSLPMGAPVLAQFYLDRVRKHR